MSAWYTIFLELAIPNGSMEFLLAYVGMGFRTFVALRD